MATYPPTPIPGSFPPPGPTSQTQIIGSYLYQEYSDDQDLQAFVNSYNNIAQTFLNTVNALNLPIYAGPTPIGPLLDWVAGGIYGMTRPVLASGINQVEGPLATYEYGLGPPLALTIQVGPTNITATSDDTFKRIMTWALYKGDGKVFTVRWLKRRIMRFLIGVNGTAPNIDQTNQISITFGPNYEVAIRFIDFNSMFVEGALLGTFLLGTTFLAETVISVVPITPLPYRQYFLEAVQNSAIELPFQFTWNVII